MTASFDFNPNTRVLSVCGKSVSLQENPARLLHELLSRSGESVHITELATALGMKPGVLEDVFEDLQAQLVEVGVSKRLVRKRGVYSFTPVAETQRTIDDAIASLGEMALEHKVVSLAGMHYGVDAIASALRLAPDTVRQIINQNRQKLDAQRAALVMRGKQRMFHQ